jgi:hypothetical protein
VKHSEGKGGERVVTLSDMSDHLSLLSSHCMSYCIVG